MLSLHLSSRFSKRKVQTIDRRSGFLDPILLSNSPCLSRYLRHTVTYSPPLPTFNNALIVSDIGGVLLLFEQQSFERGHKGEERYGK